MRKTADYIESELKNYTAAIRLIDVVEADISKLDEFAVHLSYRSG
jgi:hypothetical protein